MKHSRKNTICYIYVCKYVYVMDVYLFSPQKNTIQRRILELIWSSSGWSAQTSWILSEIITTLWETLRITTEAMATPIYTQQLMA